jgi:molecular chaperone HscB
MASTPTSVAKRDDARWPPADRITCWQCGAEHVPDFFCPSCGSIQPLPDHIDYFQVLGLPRQLTVDLRDLQRRYYDLHRRLHPDRFQNGAQPARVASLRNTAAVNRAYSTVRDPMDRGTYWLALYGESLGTNNNRVPPELAALVFETQERLEELRTDNAAPAEKARELAAVRTELQQRRQALLAELEENFARWDAGDADAAVLRRELKDLLSSLAYLGTLLRDVEKELDP